MKILRDEAYSSCQYQIRFDSQDEQRGVVDFYNLLQDKNAKPEQIVSLLETCLKYPVSSNPDNATADQIRDIFYWAMRNHGRYDVLAYLKQKANNEGSIFPEYWDEILSRSKNQEVKIADNPNVLSWTNKKIPSSFTQGHYKVASDLIYKLVFRSLLSDKFSLSLDPRLRHPTDIDKVSLAELGEYRHQIACAQHDEDQRNFGFSRLQAEPYARTPIVGRYDKYNHLFCKLFAKDIECDKLFITPYGELRFNYEIGGEIKDEPIPLTRIVSSFGINDCPHWMHTDKSHLEKILAFLEEKISSLQLPKQQVITKDDHAQLDEFIKQVAEIHWWFAHAMPFVRGSAAVGEVIIKAIFAAKGLEIKPHELIMLDCVALVYPNVEKFSEDYRNYININYNDYVKTARKDPFTLLPENINLLRDDLNAFFEPFKDKPQESVQNRATKKPPANNDAGGCSLM